MEEELRMPEHIAIIMDGNRRWARAQGKQPSEGHKAGAETLRQIAKDCNNLGIKYLTVYAFSTENWKRSKEEVSYLMFLLKSYLKDFAKKANKENIKLKVLGNIDILEKDLQKSIINAVNETKNCTGLTLNIAFNYGGRAEIVNAAKKIAHKIENKMLNIEDIDEALFAQNLYTENQPDPDILIRPGGELRVSNYLLWQLAYTEFFFIQKFWPEFTKQDLLEIIEEFNKRNRKFGGK